MAKHFGTADLTKARYVTTSRAEAVRRQGGSGIADDRPVYIVQTEGSFAKKAKEGKHLTGRVLELVIEAETGELTGWGLRQSGGDLHTLGQAMALS